MKRYEAMCWGGPLDGQSIASKRPDLRAVDPSPTEDRLDWRHQFTPTAPMSWREVEYRFEWYAITFDGGYDGEILPTAEMHYDFVRNRTGIAHGAWLMPNDGASRQRLHHGVKAVLALCTLGVR